MQQKKNNLCGRAAVVNNLLATDKTWQAPVQKPINSSSDSIVSLAQWVNSNGEPPACMQVLGERSSQDFQPCEIVVVDMASDAADPKNYGYWHGSTAIIRWGNDGTTKKLPFSMLLVKQDRMRVEVTKEHIAAGKAFEACHCPVALAVAGVFGVSLGRVSVGHNINISVPGQVFAPPIIMDAGLRQWVQFFDNLGRDSVRPLVFYIYKNNPDKWEAKIAR